VKFISIEKIVIKIGHINLFSERIYISIHRFDAPIIAYDVIPYLNEWKLLVVGYNNFIKICRVVSEKYIIL